MKTSSATVILEDLIAGGMMDNHFREHRSERHLLFDDPVA